MDGSAEERVGVVDGEAAGHGEGEDVYRDRGGFGGVRGAGGGEEVSAGGGGRGPGDVDGAGGGGGAKAPPGADQMTAVLTALATVAWSVVERPALRFVVEAVMALMVTVLGVTGAETSTWSPAASVARSQKVVGVVRAELATETPETGAEERSPAPTLVPSASVTALAKVGVTATVAPKSGLVVETAMEAEGGATTLTVVVVDLEVSSLAVAVMTMLPEVVGAFQTPVFPSMIPELADQTMTLVAPPVAVAAKVVELPAVRVGFAGVMG